MSGRAFPVVLALLLAAIPASAQDAGQDTVRFDPLLEDQRLLDLERRTNDLGTMAARGSVPDPGPAQAQGGPCFQIGQIVVEGVTILSPAEITALTRPHVPACMDGAAIQSVMRALDAAYAERGHITSKTYIPPQNLGEGRLTLSVTEGYVEDILLLDDKGQVETPRGARQLVTAFPGVKGRLFQLRDFEQGLDQMNRLASVDATLRLQPGEAEGGSYVLVQRLQQDRFRGWTRLDNLGDQTTGQRRLSLDTELDDLLGANDTWSLGYTGSQNTNALTLRGSVPYGYLTFSGDLGYSEYLTPLSAAAEIFGRSKTARFSVDHMAARDQFTTTTLHGTLNLYRSDRWINDAHLTPQALTVLELGARRMRLSEGARNSWDGTLSFGLPVLGADRDKAAGHDVPKAQFVKLAFGWQRQAGIDEVGTLVTDLRGQFSPQVLYSSQQITLGSWSTVRGYTGSAASGDSGVYLRSDLYLSPDLWTGWLPQGWRETAGQRVQPHLFLDAGITRDNARRETGRAVGIGIGASWSWARLNASALLGVPLIDGSGAKAGDPLLQLRLDMKAW